MKRILSLLLVATMVLCSVQISVSAAEPSQLKTVSVEGGVIVPGFLPEVYEYTVGVLTDGPLPDINYVLADEGAQIDIQKATALDETTIIKVTKGEVFKEYKFTYKLRNKDGDTASVLCADAAKISTIAEADKTTPKPIDNGDDFYLQGRTADPSKYADVLVKFDLRGLDYNPYGKFEFSFYTSNANYGDTEYSFHITPYSNWNGIYNTPDITYANSIGNGSMVYDTRYKAKLKKGDDAGTKKVDVTDMVRNQLKNGNEVFTIAIHMEVVVTTTLRVRVRGTNTTPKLTYTTNLYDRDTSLKEVEVKDGILDKFFSPEQFTYKIGVEEGKLPEINFVKGSPYSTVEYTPATAIGDTAIIKVIPQAEGVTAREYRFTLVSMEDAGVSETGKLEARELGYLSSGVKTDKLKASTEFTLEGQLRNNNTQKKYATLVSTMKNDGALSYINILTKEIKSGNDKISDMITTPSDISNLKLDGYIFDKEEKNLLFDKATLSNVSYTPVITEANEKLSYELKGEKIVFFGKGEKGAKLPFVLTHPRKTLENITSGDMTSVIAAFDVVTVGEKGIWELEVKVPAVMEYYNAYICDGSENISGVKVLYASETTKFNTANNVYADIYPETGSGEGAVEKTDEEKIADLKATLGLSDENNMTSEVLGFDRTVLSDVTEDAIVSTLYTLVKEKSETKPTVDSLDGIDSLNELYSQAVIIAKLNANKSVGKQAVINSFDFADLKPLYNKMISSEQERSTALYYGKNISKKAELYSLVKQDILLSLVAYPKNPADPQEIIDTYYTDFGLDMTYYSQVINKSLLIGELIDAGPYETTELLKTKFEQLAYDYCINQNVIVPSNPPSGGGGGGGSPKPSVSTAPSTGAAGSGAMNTDVFVPAVKSNFSDVSTDSWAMESVNYLSDKGIISGMGDGKFEPDRSIKREEFAKILCTAFGLELKDDVKNFSDINASEWYAEFVNIAASNGIINGIADGVFGQGMELSRQDIAVMLVRILDVKETSDEVFSDDEEISDYAKEAVYTLKKLGVLNGTGNGNFEPKRAVTRAECAKIIYGIIKK